MSRELIIRPEAEAEIDEAYDWYEARSRGLGADFLLSVEAVLREVRRTIRPHEMLAKNFELSSGIRAALGGIPEAITPNLPEKVRLNTGATCVRWRVKRP